MKYVSTLALSVFMATSLVSSMSLAIDPVEDTTMSHSRGSSPMVDPVEGIDPPKAVIGSVGELDAKEEVLETKDAKQIAKDAAIAGGKKFQEDLEEEGIKGATKAAVKMVAEKAAEGILDNFVKPFISTIIQSFSTLDEDASEEAIAKAKASADATADLVVDGMRAVYPAVRDVAIKGWNFVTSTVGGWFS